ncbi:MAG: hypothetical protein CFH17_00201, partial [Alphaproteobacteria bacterium MarineAlpha5_Bin7]
MFRYFLILLFVLVSTLTYAKETKFEK